MRVFTCLLFSYIKGGNILSAFDYKLSTITMYRSGTIDDPFIPITESKKIINQQILLSEIPVSLNGVTITGFFEYKNVPPSGLAGTGFIVDYNEGIVSFAPTQEGVTVSVSYLGRGNHFVSSSRIWTKEQNGDVTQTLADVTEAASNFYYAGDYSSTTQYASYNMVNYQGTLYISVQNTIGNLPTNSIYWTAVSGFNFKNTYSSIVSYNSGDVVVDVENYNMYQSIISGNSNNPLTDSTKWKLIISVQAVVDATEQATLDATTAISAATTATSNADTATTSANNAASAANIAKTNADTATSNANTATTNATNAATSASNLVSTFISLGAYNGTTAYVTNNIVTLSGSSWRCLQNSTGNAPVEGVYWTLVASKGSDGSGAGSVTSVSSANADISVSNPTVDPILTLNSGSSANQIAKYDANGNLQNIGNEITVKSANATLTYAESGIISVTTGASAITVTLPSAATTQVRYVIKKVDLGAGVVTIATTSSQLIDGVSTKTLTNQYASIEVVSDGTGWAVVVDDSYDKMGVLSGLNTTNKTSLVNATNEVNTNLIALEAETVTGVFNAVTGFGADPTGTTDSAVAIQNAINACGAAGGGIVYLPQGTYKVNSTLVIGNGTSPTVNSSYHFVRLQGAGRGIDSLTQPGATSIKWNGAAGGTVIDIKGMIYGVGISDMRIQGSLAAAIVLRVRSAQESTFRNINIIDPQANGLACLLDAGTGSNLWEKCSFVAQAVGAGAIKLTGTIAANRADVARQLFLACDFFHAGDTLTARGIWLEQADNNTFIECGVIPNGAVNNPLGRSIYIDQVAAPDQVFSHENVFINVAPIGGVDGTGGDGGNWFLPYPSSDGQSVPSGDNFHALTYDGKIWNGSKQRRTMRQISNVFATSGLTTTSTSYVLMTGMAITLTTKASKLKVEFTGNWGKGTAGSGDLIVYKDASPVGQTKRSVGVSSFNSPVAVSTILDVTAASHTIEIYWKSSDVNALGITERELIVTELY
jgi:hypothetical protein